MTLESHQLVQDLLQKGKGAMARMHSMIFPKIDQNKTLGQLIDAFAINTREVIEVFPVPSFTNDSSGLAAAMAKKRKWPEAELDAGATPPASEKPEAGEDPDQISNLPPDVLRRIVSLLPTKDGSRTQSLSTPWRDVFRSAPLNLGVELRREDEPTPSRLVTRILADHQAPCRRLSLTWYGYESGSVSPSLSRWLHSRALNGLSELNLWQKRKRRDEERREEDPYALPPSVLRFSPTLRILSIKCTGCMIHFPSVGDLHLPILKQLTLKGVVVSEGVLHDVLDGCPVLESLVLSELDVLNLSELDGVRGVRINSSTLRRLGVSSGWIYEPEQTLQEVIVEDAPLLEKLFLSGLDGDLSVRVLCAPKLDFLGSLPEGFTKAKLETTVLQGIVAASLMGVVRTIKVLVLRMSPPSVDDAIDFMKLFPCLEKLYVLVATGSIFYACMLSTEGVRVV
ncbi:FBD-associated F-box protein At4g13985-like [Lolium rigidum]|uniref:FBD-associated F-box protein At4g13985-like n=1 Tax=Lolium rigidum TaxID=89674 RepID=UPI001F5C19BB|nr:FBD-associated F-box protein At4g13985-like [Lolium rigidum]